MIRTNLIALVICFLVATTLVAQDKKPAVVAQKPPTTTAWFDRPVAASFLTYQPP